MVSSGSSTSGVTGFSTSSTAETVESLLSDFTLSLGINCFFTTVLFLGCGGIGLSSGFKRDNKSKMDPIVPQVFEGVLYLSKF